MLKLEYTPPHPKKPKTNKQWVVSFLSLLYLVFFINLEISLNFLHWFIPAKGFTTIKTKYMNINWYNNKFLPQFFSWLASRQSLSLKHKKRQFNSDINKLRKSSKINASTQLILQTYSPKTTCFPSSQSHLVQVMKNWQPFVPGPLFAWVRPEHLTKTGHFKTSVCLYWLELIHILIHQTNPIV